MAALKTYAVGRTNVGLVRKRNEDALFQGRRLYAVADGLGGHVAGDVASTVVIGALEPYDRPVASANLADALGKAVHDADDALRRRIHQEPALTGMGTTLVALLCAGSDAVLANIGDSRAYLVRDRSLARITEDHTYRNLVAGADAVPGLPEKITRFLDGRPDGRSADLIRLALRAGDRVLLCSDGLSSCVPHEQMRDILVTDGTREEAAAQLITAALDQGGPDNVTVLVIDVGEG